MRKGIRWILLALACLVLIFSISFYLFTFKVSKLSDENVENQLQEVTKSNYANTTAFINKGSEQLEELSYRLATTDLNEKKAVQDVLKSVIGYTSYDYVVLYTAKQAFANDDTAINENNEQMLLEVEKNKLYLSTVGKDHSIGVSIPVYVNNQLVAALQGVYSKESLARLLNINIFDQEGQCSILHKNGDYLYQSDSMEMDYHLSNLFEGPQITSFSNSYSLELLQSQMQEKESFFSRYEYGNEKQVVYFTPLDIGDWYIMSTVPESYIARVNNEIDASAFQLMLVMSVVFLSLLYIIAYLNKKEKNKIKINFEGLDRLLNTIPLPIFVITKDRYVSQMNQAASTVFNIDKEDLIGQPCCKLNTNICGTSSCAIRMLEVEDEKNVFMEIGESRFLVSTTRLYDEHNQHFGYVEVLQNITEVMNMQKILEERTLELETISQNLLGGVLITTLEDGFKVLQCNQGYLDLIDRIESDVVGKPAVSWLLDEEVQEVEDKIFRQLKSNETVSLEHMLQTKDGVHIWVFLYGRKAMLHDKEVGIWLVVNIDERKRIEQTVKLSEEKYRIASDNTENIVMDYDIEKDIMIHNDKVVDIYDVEMHVEHPEVNIVSAGVIAKESIATYQQMFHDLRAGKKKVECDLLTYNKHHREVWQHVTFTPIFDETGKPLRAIGVLHDFTKEKNAVLKYQREAQYRKVTMEESILYYEADLTDRIFLTGHEDLVQRYLSEPTSDFDVIAKLMIDHLVYEEDRDMVFQKINWVKLLEYYKKGDMKLEFDYQRIVNKNRRSWVRCTMHLYQDETTEHIRVIGFIKDIDESKKQELYLKKQAQIDQLTGLYNKMTTEYLIIDTLKKRNNQRLGALVIIDLDDFKTINDSFGHAFGDAVLSEVSQQFTKLFNKDEIVGRIGGDEFMVFLKNVSSIEEIEKRAQEVCTLFHNSYTERNNYKVSGSVGIACYPKDGQTFEELYEHADMALYSAKNGGKDNYCLYHASLPQVRSDTITRAIDANAGKQLSENISEYVLRILYEAKDPEKLVEAVLELVSKQFHFSRAYVFVRENAYWINPYEWFANGILSKKDTFQNTSFGKPGYYESHFNEEGEFCRYDVQELDQELYDTIAHLQIKSFAQFAIKRGDEIVAFVGFDDCVNKRMLSQETKAILHSVAMMLDAFVFRKKI